MRHDEQIRVAQDKFFRREMRVCRRQVCGNIYTTARGDDVIEETGPSNRQQRLWPYAIEHFRIFALPAKQLMQLLQVAIECGGNFVRSLCGTGQLSQRAQIRAYIWQPVVLVDADFEPL